MLSNKQALTALIKRLVVLPAIIFFFQTKSLIACAEPPCEQASSLILKGSRERTGSDGQIEFFRKAVSLCGEYPNAHYNLGVSLLAQGVTDLAKQHFNEAIKLKDELIYYQGLAQAQIASKEWEPAYATYQKILEKNNNSTEALIGMAVIEKQRGKLEAAEGLLRKAVASSTTNSLACMDLGILLEAIGKVDEAIKSYNCAVERSLDKLEANLRLVSLLLRLNRIDEAKPIISRLNLLSPEEPRVLISLGVYYQLSGDYQLALETLQKARSKAPQDRSLLTSLSTTLFELKDSQAALQVIEQALALYPDDADVLHTAGWLRLQLGENDKAEALLNRVAAIQPDNKTVYRNLGVLYEEKGEMEKSADFYRRAGINPNGGN